MERIVNVHRWLLVVALLSAPVLGSEIVVIPAGSFQQPIVLEKEIQRTEVEAFLSDAAPVSKAAYARFVHEHPEWRRSMAPRLFRDGGYLKDWTNDLEPAGASHEPVTQVSRYAARAHCHSRGGELAWLCQREDVMDGRRADDRLPEND